MEKALNFFKRRSFDKRTLSFNQSISPRKKSSTVKDDSFKQVKKRCLIENFAEDLLNLELDMEQPVVDVKSVHRLLELYANGVEYYESIKSNRYLIFQEKMKNLLIKPNVLEALNNHNQEDSPNKVKIKEDSPKLKETESNKAKHKELQINLYLVKQQNNQEDIKYLVEEKKNNLEEVNNIIEHEINHQKDTILDRISVRKKNQLNKCTSVPLFASPQLPRKTSKKKQSNEIQEVDEENKEINEDFESKKRKRKSILMLRKVSNELNNMIENLNFGKDGRRGSIKKGINMLESKTLSIYEGLSKNKIEEVNETMENIKKNLPPETKSETKLPDHTEIALKLKETEMKLKLREAEKKYEDEIEKLEKKMGQNKNSILISKMIEKAKNDKEKALNVIKLEYDHK